MTGILAIAAVVLWRRELYGLVVMICAMQWLFWCEVLDRILPPRCNR